VYFRLITHPALARQKLVQNQTRHALEAIRKAKKNIDNDATPASSDDEGGEEEEDDNKPAPSVKSNKKASEKKKKADEVSAALAKADRNKPVDISDVVGVSSSSSSKGKDEVKDKPAKATNNNNKRKAASSDVDSKTTVLADEAAPKRACVSNEELIAAFKKIAEESITAQLNRVRDSIISEVRSAVLPSVTEELELRRRSCTSLNEIGVQLQAFQDEMVSADQIRKIVVDVLKASRSSPPPPSAAASAGAKKEAKKPLASVKQPPQEVVEPATASVSAVEEYKNTMNGIVQKSIEENAQRAAVDASSANSADADLSSFV
jgi:hypothetical protein